MWPADTFTASAYDTAVGGQPVADTWETLVIFDGNHTQSIEWYQAQ